MKIPEESHSNSLVVRFGNVGQGVQAKWWIFNRVKLWASGHTNNSSKNHLRILKRAYIIIIVIIIIIIHYRSIIWSPSNQFKCWVCVVRQKWQYLVKLLEAGYGDNRLKPHNIYGEETLIIIIPYSTPYVGYWIHATQVRRKDRWSQHSLHQPCSTMPRN